MPDQLIVGASGLQTALIVLPRGDHDNCRNGRPSQPGPSRGWPPYLRAYAGGLSRVLTLPGTIRDPHRSMMQTTDDILIVDDEVSIAQMLADMFRDEGYKVRVAHDGASA